MLEARRRQRLDRLHPVEPLDQHAVEHVAAHLELEHVAAPHDDAAVGARRAEIDPLDDRAPSGSADACGGGGSVAGSRRREPGGDRREQHQHRGEQQEAAGEHASRIALDEKALSAG